jgi:hypothetical protein
MKQPILPTETTHELRTLHFDLGHIQYDGPLELIAAGRRIPLNKHNGGSIASLRDLLGSAVGPEVKLERLTHVAHNLPLRRNAIKLIHVRAIRGEAGGAAATAAPTGTLAAGLHIPASIRGRCRPSARKREHFGVSASDDSSFLHDLFTTDDTATVVVFFHPEAVNFDTSTFDLVYNKITDSGAAGTLAESIKMQGSGWVSSQQVVTFGTSDPKQWFDHNNQPCYLSIYSTQTCQDALLPIQLVVQSLKDIPQLEGHNWAGIEGRPYVSSDLLTVRPTLRPVRELAGTDDQPNWAIQNLSTADGLAVDSFQPGTKDGYPTLEVSLDNSYSRHLSVFAEYLDANGNSIELKDLVFPKDSDKEAPFRQFDTDTARLIDVLEPTQSFCGIPLTFLPNGYQVVIPIPADQSGGVASVNILCGGVGIGPWLYDANVPMIGIVLTAVFEYAFPVILAAVDFGVDEFLSEWFSGDTASLLLDSYLRLMLGQLPITDLSPTDWGDFLIDVINYVVTYVIPEYGAQLFLDETVELTAEASDPVGWIAMAVSLSMTVSSLAGTTSEVQQSPPVYSNMATYSMTISVNLHPDPNDPEFPNVATNYAVIARFTNGTTVRRFDAEVLANTKSLPPVLFSNIPAGGTLTVQVIFYSTDGWIAGQGIWQGECALQQGLPDLEIDLFIAENKVPLTSNTIYSHQSMLEYMDEDTFHSWFETNSPPTETSTNLQLQQPPCCTQLESLTYSVRAVSKTESEGQLGYTWQATSPQVALCGDSTTNGAAVYLSQVLSSANPPDDPLISSKCGITEPASLAFDLSNPSPESDGFYYVDPRNQDQYVYVRRFDPASSPYGQDSTSCGRLHRDLSVDDLAIFQSKFLAAINSEQSKLQIVHFAPSDGSDQTAPVARLLSGYGTRSGLMDTPVAVAVTKDGTILVLEQGNGRIQAFDEYGGPVKNCFSSAPNVSFMPMAQCVSGQVYLDMAVEPTGYIYVLSQMPPSDNNNQILDPTDYVLDIYTPQGAHLCQATTGIAAAKIDVDYWRNIWALTYHQLVSPEGVPEPSISLWTPSTPDSLTAINAQPLEKLSARIHLPKLFGNKSRITP